jgi:hypothetical protein
MSRADAQNRLRAEPLQRVQGVTAVKATTGIALEVPNGQYQVCQLAAGQLVHQPMQLPGDSTRQ